jgi:hypothetical protein
MADELRIGDEKEWLCGSTLTRKSGSGTVCSFGGASVLASRLVGSLAPPNCATTKKADAEDHDSQSENLHLIPTA